MTIDVQETTAGSGRGLLDRFIGAAIGVYRRTPLYPGWGSRLARLLAMVRRRGSKDLFVHDTGDFRMWIDLDQVIDSQIYFAGAFEPEAIATAKKFVPTGGVAIDIGANVGWFSLHLARCVGPKGTVIAFEPTPWALSRLEKNVALNGMTQVRIERLALGARAQREVSARIVSSYRNDGRDAVSDITFEVLPLDEYLERRPIDRLDFVKIDTDGMEERILRGAVSTLTRFRPAIIFELGPSYLGDHGDSAESLLSFLAALDYRFLHEGTLSGFDDLQAAIAGLADRKTLGVVAVARDRQSSGVAPRTSTA